MVAKKLVFFLAAALANITVSIHLLAIVPAPDANSDESSTAMPAPDLTSMMSPAPAPDSTVPVPAQDQAAAGTQPTAPATAEIQAEQMKGQDILELSEEKPGELVPSGNLQVINAADQSNEFVNQADRAGNQLAQIIKQIREQFNQLQSEIDTFYQTAGAQRGKISGVLDEIAPSPLPTPTLPVYGQPVAPTLMLPAM